MKSPLPLFLFLLYAVVSAIHVICCAANRQRGRKSTKVFLMPLLAAAYLCTAARSEAAVLIALLLGWIGDLLLLKPDKTPNRLGGVGAFLLGHCFYMAAIARRISACSALTLPWLPPAVFLVLAVSVYLFQRSVVEKPLRPAAVVYFLALAGLSSFAGIALLSGVPRGWAFFCGALLFFLSDSVLCRQTFTVGSPAPKFDFTVMTTYVLAQFFLVLGFCI